MPDDVARAEEAAAARVLQQEGPVPARGRVPPVRRLLQAGALLVALLLIAFVATRTTTDVANDASVSTSGNTLHPAQLVDAAQRHSKSHDSKHSEKKHKGSSAEKPHSSSSKSSSSSSHASKQTKGKEDKHSKSSRSSSSRNSDSSSSSSSSRDSKQQQVSSEPPYSAAHGTARATTNSASFRDHERGHYSSGGGGVNSSIINTSAQCSGPFPGYPYCQDHVDWMTKNWNASPDSEAFYRSKGVDGTQCSFLNYLNFNGFYCPEAQDAGKRKIRGVNLGGWLVLEPWITPSLFEQIAGGRPDVHKEAKEADKEKWAVDQWTFCEKLGAKECRRQLEKHWDSFLTEAELKFLADSGINHVRIPVGYWLFGDIRAGEPWVAGDLPYLERAVGWCQKLGLHVVLDLHCAPGSQNGFDNSGRKGEVHFDDHEIGKGGRTVYPNIQRALEVIANLTAHFSQPQFSRTVVGIELVNEAFITIPIEVVKDYYLQGYEIVKQYGDTMAVIIGDSFRFGAWNDFMFPPHYRHVWIDTHIYQVFDIARLSMTWAQHVQQTCRLNKPEVAVAPLSTMVGEWSLATTDCARWLNGFGAGARFDGSFPHPGAQPVLGSCVGQDNLHNKTIWTPEYRAFLSEFAQKQMDAYESGSSEGWFFWNFKTENGHAPQWDYMMGVKEGWIPKDLDNRKIAC